MQPAQKQDTFCVYNRRTESFLGTNITCAKTVRSRLKGLLGQVKIRVGGGVWIVPSQGVHSVGLSFPIDLVYLDKDFKVMALCEHLEPFRIAAIHLRAVSVIQLPPHTIFMSQTVVGDALLICPSDDTTRTAVKTAAMQPARKAGEGTWSLKASIFGAIRFCLTTIHRLARNAGLTDESGQSAVELAIMLPILLLLVTGTLAFGVALNNDLVLTNAVIGGAYAGAISRGQTTDPCATIASAVAGAAANLTTSNVALTITINGTAYTGNAGGASSATCTAGTANMIQGKTLTVAGTYPCTLSIAGMAALSCNLSSTTSQVIQ